MLGTLILAAAVGGIVVLAVGAALHEYFRNNMQTHTPYTHEEREDDPDDEYVH